MYNFGNHFGAIFVTYGHSLETVKFLHPFVRELHIEGFEAGKKSTFRRFSPRVGEEHTCNQTIINVGIGWWRIIVNEKQLPPTQGHFLFLKVLNGTGAQPTDFCNYCIQV